MQVAEMRPDGGPWKWAIHVKGDTVVASILLEADTHGHSENASWLDSNVLTIEQIFLFAEQHCTSRGVLNCGISYDSQYHFPKLIESYEVIVVEVDRFINCSQNSSKCISAFP